jgi:NADH-quinone oxidoreductase subunit N
VNPSIDYHALAPEIVVTATIIICLLVDLFVPSRPQLVARIASFGVLGALIPVITLAADGADRSMFGGAIVVDNYALAFQGFFLVVAYLSLLLSFDEIGEGDYYRGEYYVLMLTSVLGLLVMAMARDLVSIFVALETISIPTFVLAGWRKHDTKSNEAALKYFLIGVLSSAVMLYGMSLIYGMSSSTLLTDISRYAATSTPAIFAVAIFLTLVGFAFKVSAVPFHFWAPDTYVGAPLPVTSFLSVASKAGGFVALLTIIKFGFFPSTDSWEPILWILAAASMTLGNLAALKQTNVVRMLAYSSIAQGGFILVPLAVAGDVVGNAAWEAVIIYLVIYGAMNIGAFAAVLAVARRTHSAEIKSFSGLGTTDPRTAVLLSIFLFSLAGIPPFAGWFAKFVMFRAVFDAGTTSAVVLGVIAAINSVIAFYYYMAVVRRMWFHEAEEPVVTASASPVPIALTAAMFISTAVVIVLGVAPHIVARLGELAFTQG